MQAVAIVTLTPVIISTVRSLNPTDDPIHKKTIEHSIINPSIPVVILLPPYKYNMIFHLTIYFSVL